MFSEKNVSLRSGFAHWKFGVLILLVLMGSTAGCSSRGLESDELYSSEEGLPGSGTDQVTSLPPTESSNQTSSTDNPLGSSSPGKAGLIPQSYSPADRAVVLRYAEKGESDSGNLDAALRLVQRAETLPPTGRIMEDYLVLSAHYRFKGNMNQVVQYANQGIMSKSDSKRVRAYMFIYLGYTYESKSPTMARSYFKQAAQIDPDFYRGHYELGRISFHKKEYSEAKALLKKATNLNPDDANVYGMLGQMFYGMDLYEDAAETLKKALELSPQTSWILYKLGDTYFYGLKQRAEGARFYEQAVSKSDSDPGAHFGLALYYRYKSEYEKAEEQLQKAMALDYKNPKYKRELEDMRSEKVEMTTGIQKYEQAIADNPDDPSPVAGLGRFYLRWGKYEQAEKQYITAVELASKVSEKLAAKGSSADPDEPSTDGDSENTDEPVAQEPSRVPEYASHLGWFYFNDKKYGQAEEAFKTALKVDPKYPEAQFGLGRAYENMKQYDLAASHYAQTVTLDPKHKEAQGRLTDLKKSGKLMPVGEIVKPQEAETGEKPITEVKK